MLQASATVGSLVLSLTTMPMLLSPKYPATPMQLVRAKLAKRAFSCRGAYQNNGY